MVADGDKWMTLKFNFHYITSGLLYVLRAQQKNLTLDETFQKIYIYVVKE